MSGNSTDLIIRTLAAREIKRREFYRAYPDIWRIMEPGVQFSHEWITQLICEYLQYLHSGAINRLIINVPPRIGKSVTCIGAYPAWVWLSDPAHKFMLCSYSLGLTRANFLKTRLVLGSEWHNTHRYTPYETLHETKTEVKNSIGGHIQCQALFGSTGHGCDTQIIDDIHSAMDALSPRKRESQIEAFNTGLTSRLDNPLTSKRIIIMQRLHPKDLTGFAIAEQLGYEHLVVPFEAEDPQTLWFPISNKALSRSRGDILCPKRFTPAWVEEQKKNPIRWYTQYQQKPPEGVGSIWSAHWFQEPDEKLRKDILGKPDYFLVSVDPAGSVEDSSSYWAIGAAAVRDGKVLLFRVLRGRYQYPEGKDAVIGLYSQLSAEAPTYVLIENKSTGVSLIPDLASIGIPKGFIKGINPKGSKEARAIGVTDMAASGNILYTKDSEWWSDFWLELSTFPRSEHDDQSDMLVQMLYWLKEEKPLTMPGSVRGRNAMLL